MEDAERMMRQLMTDKELMAVSAVSELERLKKWIHENHKLRPYISMLALRRAIAKAQLKKIRRAQDE